MSSEPTGINTSATLEGNPFKVLASNDSASDVKPEVIPQDVPQEVPKDTPKEDEEVGIEATDEAPPEQAAPLPDEDNDKDKDVDTTMDTMESQQEKLSSSSSSNNKDKLLSSSISLEHSLTRNKNDAREAKPFVIAAAITAALGGLIFGYDIGGAGATFVMAGFKAHFGWDTASQSTIDTEKGLINGLFGVGAAFGALFAPKLFNHRGRKPTMNCGAVFFTVGAALQAAAVSMPMLYVPRLLSGAGIGMLSMCSPVYIAEIAPESHRGQLATLWQLAITTGIVLVSVLNIWLAEWDEGWRISYGGNIVFSVALLCILTIMPESPHFLVVKGRKEEAREALMKVRYEDEVPWELEELEMEAIESEERGEATWSEVFDNGNNKMKSRVLLGVALQSIQQLSGINAIMFYAPNILEDFFGSKGGIYGALVLNIINFFSTFITMFTIERFGRVLILFTGAILMCAALIPTAVLSAIHETRKETQTSEELQGIGIGITALCAFYVIGFAYSWGPVVWVVCAEMFPMRERGKANSVTTFSNWFWTTIVGALFPVASTASLAGCFGFFAGVVFIATFFVYLYLPETANRTAPEIDQEFVTHKPEVPRKKWN